MTVHVVLDKISEGLRVDLGKRIVPGSEFPSDINVTLALDVSGSMFKSFENQKILHILQRVVAVSNVIDDDGVLNFYCFSDESMKQQDIHAQADFEKLPSLIKSISRKGGSYWSGTSFKPVLTDIIQEHTTGVAPEPEPRQIVETASAEEVALNPSLIQKIINFFKGLFGVATPEASPPVVAPAPTITPAPEPVSTDPSSIKQLVLLITDGENFDKSETEYLFKKMSTDSRFYFQCIGVNCANRFLKNCADKYPNVGYAEIELASNDQDLAKALVSESVLRHFGY